MKRTFIALMAAISIFVLSSVGGAIGPYPFTRGDVNGDGQLDISDSQFILYYLFNGGKIPPCLESADVDGDGRVSINDAIYLNSYLFQGGHPPGAPFPNCGYPITYRISCYKYTCTP